MRSLTLTFFLFLSVLTLVFPVTFAQDAAPADTLYTPAELKRNIQRKALGMPPLKPRKTQKRPPVNNVPRADSGFVQGESSWFLPRLTSVDATASSSLAFSQVSPVSVIIFSLFSFNACGRVAQIIDWIYRHSQGKHPWTAAWLSQPP